MESKNKRQVEPSPLPSASPTELSTRKKAVKPSVHNKPLAKKKVTTPGLGMVSLTTH